MRRRRKFSTITPLLLLVAIFLGHLAGLFRSFQPKRVDSLHMDRHPCQLVRVVDGDTIVIRWQGKEEHLRLLRIDTPEHGQPGYDESADFLRNLLTEKAIAIEFEDPTDLARDRFGRLLAYVFADGQNVNVEMVRAGFSPFWTKFGGGKYADAFQNAESEANSRRPSAPKPSNGESEEKGDHLSERGTPDPLRSPRPLR